MSSDNSWEEVLTRLQTVEAKALQGLARSGKQKDVDKLSARARIEYLLDADSFTELNMLAEHQSHEFGMQEKKIPGDGVVTGYGTIDGRRVFIYAEDDSVLGRCAGHRPQRFGRCTHPGRHG